jgi:hypothetical protein
MYIKFSQLNCCWPSPAQSFLVLSPAELVIILQPVGGSELQRVVDRTRDKDFTRAVVQRVPAVQCSAARSNWGIAMGDKDFK